MKRDTRLRLSRTHRILGLAATVPLVGWIASSFVLHGVGLALPNGLQGVYELGPSDPVDDLLEQGSGALPPAVILSSLAEDGFQRIYWLRLEAMAGRPVYVVKPDPFALERMYDAWSGDRLDPLPIETMRAVAEAELSGTHVAAWEEVAEFNRYYTGDEVPGVAFEMEGSQPSTLVLSRASGRTLRRTDPLAGWFDRAYRSVHVWQWGDAVGLFTGILFGLVALTTALIGLGYVLWFDRRQARKRWTSRVRAARRIHARVAPFAGLVLVTQMLVGAYLWFNLGLIEPRFRGQGSFRIAWCGGIEVGTELASPESVRAAFAAGAGGRHPPVQRYEWRAVGKRIFELVYPSRNGPGRLRDAESGELVSRLSTELARDAAEAVVAGQARGKAVESEEYWMDSNSRVPTYLFRFDDPHRTDVHVSQITGEIVQRRPAIWRAFEPFLRYHTFGLTGNPWLDTVLLSVLQLTILAMVVSGWRLALRASSKGRPSEGRIEPLAGHRGG